MRLVGRLHSCPHAFSAVNDGTAKSVVLAIRIFAANGLARGTFNPGPGTFIGGFNTAPISFPGFSEVPVIIQSPFSFTIPASGVFFVGVYFENSVSVISPTIGMGVMGVRGHGPVLTGSSTNFLIYGGSNARTYQSNNPVPAPVAVPYNIPGAGRDLGFKFEFIGQEGTE